MAKALNVNPNRMELSRLKKRVVVAKRGHKLLKDKQDALIKEFLQKAREVKSLREDVERELLLCYQSFRMARAQTLPSMIEQSLMCAGGAMSVQVSYQNVMSVNIPRFLMQERPIQLSYGLASSPGSLDIALERFSRIMRRLVELAAEEKGLKLMALEIERTRRRVNALEHVMIPSFTDAIRSISMKLEENERSTLSRLMVVKEIVRSH
ncbi:MAG: V-type ATP synthase subunit D [Synergistaceae bacterium]|jgi:V/A-type H+-transporting ATPase subunit D|nr:V-type ATP synthase subunit D [Synergistaceae bacterium]